MEGKMIGSLYSSITGLKANSTALAVIGDNIANVNTTAFKSSSVSFTNLLSDSFAGSSSSEIGKGVEVQSVNTDWEQGIIQGTGNTTDLAINGDGFFMLENEWGEDYYSRAGGFYFDENDVLVNSEGLFVQGYSVDDVNDDGSLDLGSITDIDLSGISSAPVATDEISTNLNLNAGTDVGDTFNTTVSVYDSLGNSVPITFEFTRTDTGWDWSASWSDSISSDAPITGSLEFDSNGNLVSPTTNPTITITNLENGASDLNITWNILNEDGTSNGNITGYAYASVTTSTSKTGNPAGTLQGISIDDSGIVYGEFSNGKQTPLYQLVIADFSNVDGLNNLGNGLYEQTVTSGDVVLGTAGTGGFGVFTPESLEMSNVDMTTELVDMITVQSAYAANAKVIKTSEEMLNVLINLKT
jgi:flagellar hook protein FlgE